LRTLRKLLAFFCVIAVLWTALAPASSGLSCAILVPLLILVGVLAVVLTEHRLQEHRTPLSSFLSVTGSRAPPLLDSLI
jgi:hypothetical protein